jgi:hypothetical protein
MDHYDSFIFEEVNFRPHAKKIVLRYSLDHKISFEETLLLPGEPMIAGAEKRGDVQRALFALHLVGGISYYKTYCPLKMDVRSGTLSKAEAQFWNTVYVRGLGQFFYENKMDFRNRINFPSSPTRTPTLPLREKEKRSTKQGQPSRILVPIGGGKDSLVTIELLKKSGANLALFRMRHHPLIDELAHRTGLPLLTVKRSLSPALFDLNEQGALNGHVPITAYLSILSILLALLYDFDAVAMSNESSANEGNVQFNGMEVNHQWSKSLEFEKMLRTYVRQSIGTDIEYFSLLRPFSELKIAEHFTHYPQYFHSFTSCNTNWKILAATTSNTGRWCGKCPKCASIFALLAAFLKKDQLTDIFGANLFANEAFIPLYRTLLGIEGMKPFECVGTLDETKAAFLLTKQRGDLNETPVMKMFTTEVLPTIKNSEKLMSDALALRIYHCIPPPYSQLITHSS